MSDLSLTVLLSAGRHPVSGRARRAALDARALELALALPRAEVAALHAGDPTNPALRDYLGMGLGSLAVLRVEPDSDVLPPLLDRLRERAPDLLLCGQVAEAGEGSGLLPYLLAEALDWPIVAQAVALAVDGNEAEVLQGLPGGQRRALRVALPCVVTVGPAAPAPRQVAFGPARRGVVEGIAVPSVPDREIAGRRLSPARPRPKRLKIVRGASAAERLAAATGQTAKDGQVISGADPRAAAEAIYNALVEEDVL